MSTSRRSSLPTVYTRERKILIVQFTIATTLPLVMLCALLGFTLATPLVLLYMLYACWDAYCIFTNRRRPFRRQR